MSFVRVSTLVIFALLVTPYARAADEGTPKRLTALASPSAFYDLTESCYKKARDYIAKHSKLDPHRNDCVQQGYSEAIAKDKEYASYYNSPRNATDAEIGNIRISFRSLLKDPMSTQFADVKIIESRDKTRYDRICGKMNSRNSFGAYTGFHNFSADGDGKFVYIAFIDDEGSSLKALSDCKRFGL